MKLGICVRIKETISRASILLTFVIRYSSSSLTVIPVYYPPSPQKKSLYQEYLITKSGRSKSYLKVVLVFATYIHPFSIPYNLPIYTQQLFTQFLYVDRYTENHGIIHRGISHHGLLFVTQQVRLDCHTRQATDWKIIRVMGEVNQR